MRRLRALLATLAALGGATMLSAPAAADCAAINEGIRTALSQTDIKVYDALYGAMLAEPACDSAYRDRAGRAMARSVLTTLPLDAPPERISEATRFARPWQVLVALGDAFFDRQRWADAVGIYEEALDDMRNVAANPKPPPEDIERRTYKRAVESRALAPSFVATRQMRGRKSGLASPEFRNFTAEVVPVPVRFGFDSDELTGDGYAAVEDMFAYLRVAYPDYVTIIGHTDPKGSEAYNDDLSLRRARTVASHLYSLGYTGGIEAIGLGERQRFIPDDANKYTEDQLHAFDRRVEYRVRR